VRTTAGFTLVELLISLVLMILALALAGQLLMETQQMFVDANREQLDPAASLVIARIRGDVLASSSFTAVRDVLGQCVQLLLEGHPSGAVAYGKAGGELRRWLVAPDGSFQGGGTLLHGVSSWSCSDAGGQHSQLLRLQLTYRRSRSRRSPLPLLPASETRTETLFLAPRGGGFGSQW
jgi:type II secretory pathway pseudopilin PulG